MASWTETPAGITRERQGSTDTYLLADARGDITATAGSSGALASTNRYGPWGAQISGPPRRLGFLGAFAKMTDSATAQLTLGARTYDPAQGILFLIDGMRKRWTAAGMLEAETKLRRVIGYRDLAKPVEAIEREQRAETRSERELVGV